jgi:hypothetical protein
MEVMSIAICEKITTLICLDLQLVHKFIEGTGIDITDYSSHYSDRLCTHPNDLAVNLLRLPDNRCLRRFLPTDLPDRF